MHTHKRKLKHNFYRNQSKPQPLRICCFSKEKQSMHPLFIFDSSFPICQDRKDVQTEKKAQQLCFDPSHIFKERSRLYQWGRTIWMLWG